MYKVEESTRRRVPLVIVVGVVLAVDVEGALLCSFSSRADLLVRFLPARGSGVCRRRRRRRRRRRHAMFGCELAVAPAPQNGSDICVSFLDARVSRARLLSLRFGSRWSVSEKPRTLEGMDCTPKPIISRITRKTRIRAMRQLK